MLLLSFQNELSLNKSPIHLHDKLKLEYVLILQSCFSLDIVEIHVLQKGFIQQYLLCLHKK